MATPFGAMPATHLKVSPPLRSLLTMRLVRGASFLALLSIAAMSIGCGGPPVIDSEEAFATVDALYTAVTSRRTELVSQVEKRLQSLKADGKLSDAASQRLDAIIAQSRSGKWQPAAEQLDHFIRKQPSRKHGH